MQAIIAHDGNESDALAIAAPGMAADCAPPFDWKF